MRPAHVIALSLGLAVAACTAAPRPAPSTTPASAPATKSPELDRGALLAGAQRQAERVGQAIVADDLGTVADLTYPKVVELMGGRDRMIATLGASMARLREQGVAIRAVRVGAPTRLEVVGPMLLAIVPMTLEMTVPRRQLVQESYLLGVSTTRGRTWTFVDGAGLSNERLRQVLPEFPRELQLPEKKPPVVTPAP